MASLSGLARSSDEDTGEVIDLVEQDEVSSSEDSVLGSTARSQDPRTEAALPSLLQISDSSEEELLEAYAEPDREISRRLGW